MNRERVAQELVLISRELTARKYEYFDEFEKDVRGIWKTLMYALEKDDLDLAHRNITSLISMFEWDVPQGANLRKLATDASKALVEFRDVLIAQIEKRDKYDQTMKDFYNDSRKSVGQAHGVFKKIFSK